MKNYSLITLILSLLMPLFMANAQNLIDYSDWVAGTSGATTNFNLRGTIAQNSRINMTGPYGNQITVWRAAADGNTGFNGGLSHRRGVLMDTSKIYRVSFWVYSEGPNNCTNYTGYVPYDSGGSRITSAQDTNGASTTWPYFSTVALPNSKWYLVVGYIRPASANDIGDSGLYDPSQGTASNPPSPSYASRNFVFPSSFSEIRVRIRSFMWSCDSGDEMFVYDPRVEEAPNTTPLSNLLYGTSSADTQAPTAPTLSSTGQTDTTANLSWSGATDNVGVTGYRIFQNGTSIATVGNVTSYQATGLTEDTTYSYTVSALDAAGNESNQSNSVSVTTSNTGNPPPSGDTVWSKTGTTASYAGEVAVGTTSVPNGYKMAVDGKLITEEVRVELSGSWPDYVFKEGYDLPSLEEIKKHIQEKGHLPNIPSAKEAQAKGIEVGEMNRLLLEKIEEQMLYILKLEERIKALEKKNN